MVIGICDGDRIWCRKAEQMIEQFVENANFEAEIYCFAGSGEMLAYSGLPLDVLFLDIELEGENGIEVARKLNEKWKSCQIVYLTNYLNYATDVYQTDHVYFVMKEQFADRMADVFSKISHNQEQGKKKLAFACREGRTVFLSPDEIYYFERKGRKTVIETVWGSYEIKDRMDEILLKLPEMDFVRCHNSYIVYLNHVKEAGRDFFQMENGATIMISRGYAKETREAFARWVRTQL